MPELSPKAVVHNPAGLAEDVQVGPFSYLGPDVTAEPGVVIANNVTVTGHTRLGRGCRLFPGCIIGTAAGGDRPGSDRCVIEPNTTIREHVTIEAGTTPAGTVVGANSLLMVGCQVGHDAVTEANGIFANFTRIEHHAHVEKFVQTSGFATVSPYATVGAYTYTTGYAIIDRDAPPFAIADGFPFRVRSVNDEKLHRCGFTPEAVGEIKHAFRMIFNGEAVFPTESQLAQAEQQFGGEHVRFLLAFIRRSVASPTGRHLQPAESM